jgi:hypothetical protein
MALDARTRLTATVLGVAAGMLFAGTIARVWFSGPAGNVGLAGVEVCTLLSCTVKTWLDVHAPADITLLGLGGFLFGIKTFALAIHAFVMVVKREPVRIRRRWLLASAAIAVACSIGFLARMLGEPMTLSYPGFFAIFGGIALFAVVYRIRP